MNNTKLLVAGIATALSLGYGASALAATAPNSVHAESVLTIQNFLFNKANDTAITYCLPGAGLTCSGSETISIAGNGSTGSTGSTASELNGTTINGTPFPGSLFTSQTSTSMVGDAQNGATGSSSTSGNALVAPGDDVTVSSKAFLDGQSGGASGSSAQGLTNIQFLVTGASFRSQISFTAVLDLLAGIGDPYNGAALAKVEWKLTLTDLNSSGNLKKLEWAPNFFSGLNASNQFAATNNSDTDLFDDFYSLNNTAATLPSQSDVDFGFTSKFFGIEANLLNGHNYSLGIVQTNSTSVSQVVPEPTTLALLGLGMLGMGAARRRKA